ncbi:MAG: endolytic transglycosylase MltG [Hyphomicrobiaceae bacterium]|nr:endolytic transglycosylase MltG [Hyphomicrobiaceae bacterium]
MTTDTPISPNSPQGGASREPSTSPTQGGDALSLLRRLAQRHQEERDAALADLSGEAENDVTVIAPSVRPAAAESGLAVPVKAVETPKATETTPTTVEPTVVAAAAPGPKKGFWGFGRRATPPAGDEAAKSASGAAPVAQAKGPQEVPPPPAKRGRWSKTARNPMLIFFNGLFTVLLIGGLLAVIVIAGSRGQFDQPGPLTQAKAVVIPNGAGVGAIADTLERAGVISSATVFELGVQMAGTTKQLKAGEFEFAAQSTPRQVMDTIMRGKAVEYSVTIPEGWSSEQVVTRLNQEQLLAGRIGSVPLEGSLLPDTYRFTRGAQREQVLDTMRRAQEKLLAEIWAKRLPGLPINSPRDLVILASIVEKETGQVDERRVVASVFINRLKRGMRLESDPTILYGLYQGKAWMEPRTIKKSELEAPNAYSTYKIPGLPPGPIANPGRAAMEAVANPETTNFLFFVADGTGGHAFADTLEQHNKNVAKWRQIEQQRQQNRVLGITNSIPAPSPPGSIQTLGAPATGAPAAAATPNGGLRPLGPASGPGLQPATR